jgi:hypothetical protein
MTSSGFRRGRACVLTMVMTSVVTSVACGTRYGASEDEPDGGAPSSEAGTNVDAPTGSDANDANDASDSGAPDAATDARKRLVFVTSTKVLGNMDPSLTNGRAGGDQVCQSEAVAAGLAGNFVAWLSTTGNAAIDRLPDDETPWALRSGQVVFPRRDHITQGGDPFVPIVEGADGGIVQALPGARIFTGTSKEGLDGLEPCLGWTAANSNLTVVGTFGSKTKWGWGEVGPCDERNHLLCFEK